MRSSTGDLLEVIYCHLWLLYFVLCLIIIVQQNTDHFPLLLLLSAKLHYMDTGRGHVVQHHWRTPPTDKLTTSCTTHEQTSSQQFYNLLYNKFTANGQKFATSQHLDMSRCWALALRCGKFVVQQVVELLWACPLVVYDVRSRSLCVVEFGPFTGWQQDVVQQI